MPNHLINETSPYLLQHVHNPVDWYPWGEEALQKAKLEDKPILVSIGYAACHWCHVMEHESFEDEETAKLMNAFFVNIKIDREERPDLDHIYMDALQAMSGSGGWPLNVFLTPDKKPFYGGTYFPPKPYYNRPSWKDVLVSIHQYYTEKKEEVLQQANKLTDYIKNANTLNANKTNALLLNEEMTRLITENILQTADKKWGGFSRAPKFPQTFTILNLLRGSYFQKNEAALQQALLSLDKMVSGGIYDHAGGGFSRYSTDEYWLAPHFEKMLYDNALLVETLSEAYQLTRKEHYKKTIEETIAFVERELMHEDGGFFCALDADSEGVEGKFYTWSKTEIDEILKEDSRLFCKAYHISAHGNWEHTNILWLPKPLEQIADEEQTDKEAIETILARCKEKLFNKRTERIRPATDDKVISGLNALMISALCKAYAALGTEHYSTLATTTMQLLEKHLYTQTDGKWKHTFKNGEAKINAFLDDLAYLVKAYIDLHETTTDTQYLLKAKLLTEFVIHHFSDEENVLFYFTEAGNTDVILRKKEIHDGATPSGNAVMAGNLQHLSIAFDMPEWNERALQMLQSIGHAAIQHPVSFGVWCLVAQKYVYGINEIAVTGKEAREVAKKILHRYIPHKILFASNVENEQFALLAGKEIAEETRIYLCKNYACSAPVTTVEELMNAMV